MNPLRPFSNMLGALVALALLVAPHSAFAGDDDEDTPPGTPTTPGASAPVTPAPVPVTPAPPVAPAPVAPAPTPVSHGPVVPVASPPVAPAPPAVETASAPPAQLGVPPASDGPTYKLIGGAPLGDPDVRVHIVEKKPLSDYQRHEVVFFPLVGQINGKFTDHLGIAAEYLYHFQENIAFQVTPMYYYISNESGFNQDLINIAQLQAGAATALTMIWGAEAGIEATPIYGKFAFYDGYIAHFALVLNAGIGLGDTHVQLQSSQSAQNGNPAQSATFGDTGYKFMGNVGGGFRVKFGDHWAIRLELRDLVYSASVDSINGCNLTDLSQLQADLPPVSSGCSKKSFASVTDPATGSITQPDVVIAKNLIKTPSSDVLNQVEFFSGIAYVF